MITAADECFKQFKGKAVWCVCAYRASRPYSFATALSGFHRLGRVLDGMTAYPLRQFIANNRDHAANPRSVGYQLGVAQEIVSFGGFSESAFILDARFSDPAMTRQFEQLGPVSVRDIAMVAPNDVTGYNAVILVYPDALGLGWSGLERKLLAGLRAPVFFANGRRRLMLLDAAAHRRLVWRRALANSRVAELLFGMLVIPVAISCAAVDALRGKS